MDVEAVSARVCFDVAARRAHAQARLEFRVDGPGGLPAFDLRQDIASATLDGRALDVAALAHRDLGAGEEARMRVLDVLCEEGSRHVLELDYELGEPQAVGSRPVDWDERGGVTWDLWMSDLEPGRYLEMWVPAGLCHDRFELALEVEVTGTDVPHVLMANGDLAGPTKHAAGAGPSGRNGTSWSVRYPEHYTSLSPMLVLVPEDDVEVRRGPALGAHPSMVTVGVLDGAGVDADGALADATAWLAYFTARYGAWAHGEELLVVVWQAQRGMEYDGATTASAPVLEHEIFHSWFGRGVKPLSARDGWMDEAMATWATSSFSAGGTGRYAAIEMGLDEDPVLLSAAHPWARHTPRASYTSGARLLAGIAQMLGGPVPMRAALAEWHRKFVGAMASTEDLRRHLESWCGRDLSPWWDRYVHGGDPAR